MSWIIENTNDKARIAALEAKLAKAVEAAYREGFLCGTEDGWVNNPRIDIGWKCSRARATLAELKGEKLITLDL